MSDWYVIQVITGREESTLNFIKEIVNPEVLIDSFIPYTKIKKKYHGEWHMLNEVLFRGYIFLVTDNTNELYQELKKVPKLTKLLGMHKDALYPLSQEEIAFIKMFSKDDNIIDYSIGYIEGDKVTVIDGPLQGKEAMIRKIDRHKRIAYLDIDFFNQTVSTKVGLEIIKKN